MNVLAFDVGTSSVKAAVFDAATGQPLGSIAKVGYALDAPVPEASELPAQRLWDALGQASRGAVRQANLGTTSDRDVNAIGLTTLTPGLVLLGEDDKPLTPIWTHLDRRSRTQARQTWAAVGEEFLASVGNRPLPGGISVLCYRQELVQEPYLIQDVASYLHVNGWLAFHMTGQRAFDPANACFTGLFGTLTDQRWSSRWCDYFEVDPAWLPPVLAGDATVGTLRSAVAADLGVPAGIPVKLGTADTSSAMLAAGMKHGDLLHVVGTTQVLATFCQQPAPSPKRLTKLFGIGKQFVHVTHNPVGGVAFEWIHRLCFREQSEQEFYEKTIPQALERRPRVSLDPPFLGGDRLEIDAARASFRDLELTTDRLDLLAALLQTMARRHNEALEALGQGTSFHRIFLSGGGAKVIRQLLPGYQSANVEIVDEASLRGVVKLFERD
jgi:xylulokinase